MQAMPAAHSYTTLGHPGSTAEDDADVNTSDCDSTQGPRTVRPEPKTRTVLGSLYFLNEKD
jgi:hypothetical protein